MNKFVIVDGDRNVCLIEWGGGNGGVPVLTLLYGVAQGPQYVQNHSHLAKVDNSNRCYGGPGKLCCDTDDAEGAFYRYSHPATQATQVNEIGSVKCSCGLDWNWNTNKFNFIDSCEHDLKQFD